MTQNVKTNFLIKFLSKPHINELFDLFEKQDLVNNFPKWVLNYYVSDEKQKNYIKSSLKFSDSEKYHMLTYFDELKKIKKFTILFALKPLPTDIIKIIYTK